jgi:hypothetical protein
MRQRIVIPSGGTGEVEVANLDDFSMGFVDVPIVSIGAGRS